MQPRSSTCCLPAVNGKEYARLRPVDNGSRLSPAKLPLGIGRVSVERSRDKKNGNLDMAFQSEDGLLLVAFVNPRTLDAMYHSDRKS